VGSLGKVKRGWEVRKEQQEMWAAALDLYLSLEGSGASGRLAVGATAARAVSEEFPDEATAVSCCGITDMNNTIVSSFTFYLQICLINYLTSGDRYREAPGCVELV
jgi:hypothetical protein